MQDRNVEFPNRFRMVKVEGTDDIYDMIPAPGDVLNPGTLLNKANLLTDETARLLGMEQENPTVDEAFVKVQRNVIEKPAFQKIASYETAGSYEWTAPDLADGKAYRIGVMIIGAGGSGASASTSTKYAQYGGGGASGYAKSHIETVDPGETKNLVVGKGGTSVGGSSAVNGKPGGTSSFDGIAVNGGAEGHWCNSNSGGYGDRSIGARCGNPFRAGSFGFELPYFNNSSSDSTFDDIPWMCFNPFEGVEILGSGGSATWAINSTVTYKNGGKNTDGKGGGNAGNPGVNGELPGCGGGGTVNLKKSGAGADGAVYIYFLGVADE